MAPGARVSTGTDNNGLMTGPLAEHERAHVSGGSLSATRRPVRDNSREEA
jgi:hypothetical protein